MADESSDLEQLEQETPGFKDQYTQNFEELGQRRKDQGIVNPDITHLHHEAVDFTKKDIDNLTTALKREVALAALEKLAEEIQKTGEEVVLGFIDVNYLRTINEDKGHTAGDYAMKIVGRTARRSIRAGDIIGRYGGDELIVAFRKTNLEEAEKIINERLLNPLIKGINISVGLKKMKPGDLNTTIKEADAAMYVAKEEGHKPPSTNQVRVFEKLTQKEKSSIKVAV